MRETTNAYLAFKYEYLEAVALSYKKHTQKKKNEK